MMHRFLLPLAATLLLAGCDHSPPPLLGTLEWDRVAVLAEAAEPIVKLDVVEGDQVKQGQELMQLDARRTQDEFDQAAADVQRLQANLTELQRGARIETIDASRAALARATTQQHNAEANYQRIAELAQSGVVTKQNLDDARTTLNSARADADNQRAQLQQLLHGTRIEDLDQAEASLAAAQANQRRLQITLNRMTVRAPRDGRVDALPFKLGDQPPQGAVLVSLLTGPAPYARVFVPASRRALFPVDGHFKVHVEGLTQAFDATVRSIRSRPDFTPYYALTGDDASQLTYRAELYLSGEAAHKLPAGLPVSVEPAG